MTQEGKALATKPKRSVVPVKRKQTPEFSHLHVCSVARAHTCAHARAHIQMHACTYN